jgi:hypothetical protein
MSYTICYKLKQAALCTDKIYAFSNFLILRLQIRTPKQR